MTTINLNDSVIVTLNETGAEILNTYKDSFSLILGSPKASHKAGEEYRDQLWSIMQIFGSRIRLGFRLPFESAEIKIK